MSRWNWFRVTSAGGAAVAWGVALWIASHRSASGQVLGRYSADYFKVVVLTFACAGLLSAAQVGPVYRRLFGVRFQLVMLGTSTLFALALVEIGVRVLDPLGISYYDDLARYQADLVMDPDLGYIHRPGLETRYYGARVSCNALGFRERPIGEKKPDEFRVMVLGDSVAFGVGVEGDETFSRQLETLLAGRLERPVRTLNMGVASYNTLQELACLQKFGESLLPDLVICLFVDNDIVLKVGDFGPAMKREAPKSSPSRRIVKLFGKSWLYRVAAHVFRHRGAGAVDIPRDSMGWIGSMAALEEMSAYCKTRGIGFVTFLWRTGPSPLTDALWEDISATARKASFPAADVGPWFAGVDLLTVRNSAVDGHPNARGHEIAAKGMARFLLESGVLQK